MSFCVNCGEELTADAKFCKNCGTAVAVPAGGSAHDVSSSAVEAQAAEPLAGQAQQSAELAAGIVPRTAGPFAALPIGDYVRDGIAAALLIASLFMVWQYSLGGGFGGGSISATRIDVILITLLSLASLGIPYLWRAGVFGPRWNYAKTQDARLLANAPYFAMVVIYLVVAVVASAVSDRLMTFALGPAMAFGLAGAVLAAQPRHAELAAGDVRRDRRWVVAVLLFAGVVALLTVVQIIELLFHASLLQNSAFDAGSLLIVVLMGLASAVILATIAAGIGRSENSWRLVGIGLGVVAVVFGLLSLSPQITLVQAQFDGGFPAFSLTFWIAFGAAVAAPSITRRTRPLAAGARPWMEAVRVVLAAAIGLNALMGAIAIVALVRSLVGYAAFFTPVPWVVALFFSVIGVVGGIVARAMVAKDSRQGHALATGYAALLFVLGLVLVILWSVQSLGGISPLTMLIAFAIPGGLIALLWGPESVRRHFATLPASGGPVASGFSFEGTGPVKPERPGKEAVADAVSPAESALAESASVGAASTGVGQTHAGGSLDAVRAEAANPATSAERLCEIASTIPEARAAVASNPTAYPDLLTWLGNLGDPDVDAALERRPR